MFSPANPAFSHHLLNNPHGLTRFMSGQETIAEIEKLSKNPKFAQAPSDDTPYFGRWKVIWITIKHPFEATFSVFLTTTSYLLNGLYFCKTARVLSVLSKQMTRDWQQLMVQWNFNKPMLVPAFNALQTQARDVYQYGDYPIKDVTNEEVYALTTQNGNFQKWVKQSLCEFYIPLEASRKKQGWWNWIRHFGETISDREKEKTTREFQVQYKKSPSAAIESLKKKYSRDLLDRPLRKLYYNLKYTDSQIEMQKELNLFSPHGVCRGTSVWFIYLYLKTQHLFKDPARHVRAVAEQLKAGASSQAALSQVLHRSETLLNIKMTKQKDHKISLYELDFNKESVHEKVRSLSEGVYRVGPYHHSFVYIKMTETKGYVWDPNKGLLPMNGDEMLKFVRDYHYKSGDPDSHLYFEKYDNLETV